jgi:hypothetical protein
MRAAEIKCGAIAVQRPRILPVVNPLVVDVREGQHPVVIHEIDIVVFELGQVDDAFMKLIDLNLPEKSCAFLFSSSLRRLILKSTGPV